MRRRPYTLEERIAKGAQRLGMPLDEYRGHVQQHEKWCWVHQTWHPRADFGPRPGSVDGLDFTCRDGNRERARLAMRRLSERRRAEREAAYAR